ncbi:MAG TPA: hypothetical protein VHQ47_08580 [Phycisphaerae bacterium]|nr:hypothetical protein [Phycisphaerae bacterium]
MTRKLPRLAAGLLLCLSLQSLRAGAPVMNQLVEKSIAKADVIVAVTIQSFTPDADFKPPTFANDGPTNFAADAINPPGAYHFQRLQAIKGDTDAAFDLHLPLLSYEVLGNRPLQVPTGSPALLLLKKDSDGKLAPVDPILPLIPLSADAFPKARASATQKTPDAISLLLASLPDERVRLTLVTLLDPPLRQPIVDQRIAPAMRAYLIDKNVQVRDQAIDIVARTQDVSLIPKIAAAAVASEAAHVSSGPVGAFAYYKTAAAVPYLNPLILEGTDYTRLNAMMALRPIADASSIPYLIQALDKDDSQHRVSYVAYATLHRLIPQDALPPLVIVPQFQKNKAQEIQAIKDWWTHEKSKWNPATMPAERARVSMLP